MYTVTERERLMVDQHGEVCTKVAAAKILGCGPSTVRTMLEDGRLDTACAGKMVDVRSIARYIAAPAQENFEARKRKYMLRNNTQFVV